MTSVKTAISLDPVLLEKVDTMAKELGISRSQAFATAAQGWIEQFQNEQLLEDLNAAYADESDEDEERLKQAYKNQQRRLTEGQW
jgi:metal-responsive CopG/Arc/MetJ family transcriptional regulator